MALNERAAAFARDVITDCERLKIEAHTLANGSRVIDCGIESPGGLAAGIALATVCLSDLSSVSIRSDSTGPVVQVNTDHPVGACIGSQYAGWPVSVGKYFAMGSGPMRAARGKEEVLEELQLTEQTGEVVGVLETAQLPGEEVTRHVAEQCGVSPERLTLFVAPTSSIAGTIQVVARSVETCLHKMHELGFDLRSVASGHGVAPLPPIAKTDIQGIGWTNDAVLYGGQVTLWGTFDIAQVEELGPKIPSRSSHDYGRPFADIFKSYDNDFYKIDPLLFSPAQVTLIDLKHGRSFRYGNVDRQVLVHSFGR